MTLILLGALLAIIGLVYLAGQPLWRGRLSGGRHLASGKPTDTLEPPRPAKGLGIRANWPGLALLAAGAALMLAAAVY